MFQRRKSIVGLDIGSSNVKAVELGMTGRGIEVTGFAQMPLPTDDADARTDAIVDLMQQGNFKTRHIVTGLSGNQIVIRYLNMVPMSDDELRHAILFEAEKYIPYPIDECVMDCDRIHEDGTEVGSGEANIVLVAGRKDEITEHTTMLSKAGFTPETIDVEQLALGNAHALIHGGSDEDPSMDQTLCYADIGASKTTLNVVRNGSSLFTREIQVGGRDMTDALASALGLEFDEAEALKIEPGERAEEVQSVLSSIIDEMSTELQMSFDYVEGQHEHGVDRVYISGGAAMTGGLRELMEGALEKPTFIFNPFETVALSDDIDPNLLTTNGHGLTMALGLAARIGGNC